MTSPHADIALRSLLRRGYIDAAPTRAKLRQLYDAGVVTKYLAEGLGVNPPTLFNLRTGRAKAVRPELAAAIEHLSIDEAVDQYTKPRPYVDEVILHRILDGTPVTIAAHDKPAYAHALHAHGWYKTWIADAIGVSGATINKILGEVAA